VNSRNSLISTLVGVALSYAIMELYLAFRPSNLTEQINEYFSSTRGRFDAWYAEQTRPPTPDWDRDED
jgi:hypothetical protein